MKNLIDIVDLTTEEIDELIAVAEDIIENPAKYHSACANKRICARACRYSCNALCCGELRLP